MWEKGQTGNPNGRPKGFVQVARTFRKALLEAPPGKRSSMMQKVIDQAFDDKHPLQGQSQNTMFAYGIGLPPKKLDDDTVARLAAQMVAQGIAEARARLAARGEQKQVDAIGVEPSK